MNIAQKLTRKIRAHFGNATDALKKAFSEKPKKAGRRVYFRDINGVRHLPSGARYAMYKTGWSRLNNKNKGVK